jgi:hypothetical protein
MDARVPLVLARDPTLGVDHTEPASPAEDACDRVHPGFARSAVDRLRSEEARERTDEPSVDV